MLLLPISLYDAPNLFEAAQGIDYTLLSCVLRELRTCSLSQLAASAQQRPQRKLRHSGPQRPTCKGFRCFNVWIVTTRSENSAIEDKLCPRECIRHDNNKVSLSDEPVTNSTGLAQEPGET